MIDWHVHTVPLQFGEFYYWAARPTIFDDIETRDKFLARLAAVFGWVSSGRLRLKMDHVYPLERAAAAQIALAGRQTTGKVLLVP